MPGTAAPVIPQMEGAHLAVSTTMTVTPVLIVTYRNADDLVSCLMSLRSACSAPAFEVFVCENGGARAYSEVIGKLVQDNGPCPGQQPRAEPVYAPAFARQHVLTLDHARARVLVHVAEARENLGYAGGINAWLRSLLPVPGWPAVWILNPDTQPAPDALLELSRYSLKWGKGMIGSRQIPRGRPGIVHSRGLAWSKLRATARSVDLHVSDDFEPDPLKTDSRLDSPSGASMYVTRSCIEQIGLMDERYFLYFEDVEWGLRAKKTAGIGYAHRSAVVHTGGTTIGSSIRTGRRSALSVYLECRNSVLFVRTHFPLWLVWTLLLQLFKISVKAPLAPSRNFRAALSGLMAGLRGQTGRPDHLLQVRQVRLGRRG
jgi:N-acetylglucosaminyl-diphospho-decaprenol L-rhamnosyltransferase